MINGTCAIGAESHQDHIHKVIGNSTARNIIFP